MLLMLSIAWSSRPSMSMGLIPGTSVMSTFCITSPCGRAEGEDSAHRFRMETRG